MTGTVIVSTWGKPSGWRKASYIVEVPRRRDIELKECGWFKSTLGALVSAFPGSFLVVFVADTLADSMSPMECEDYDCVRELASKYARQYLEAEEYVPPRQRVELRVSPGCGAYRNLVVRGGPALFALNVYLYVLEKLREYRPETIVLDVSHGVNYMPLYAYYAVKRAATVYVLERGVELSLLVYNSDPVLKDGQTSILHLVERRDLKWREVLPEAYSEVELATVNLKDLVNRTVKVPALPESEGGKKSELGRMVRQLREFLSRELTVLDVKELFEKSVRVVKAARRGLILCLAYDLAEGVVGADKVRSYEELLFKLLERAVGLGRMDEQLVIYHYVWSGDLLYRIHTGLVVGSALRRVLEGREPPFLLADLWRVHDELIVDEAASMIVKHELGEYENYVRAFAVLSRLLGIEVEDREIPYKVVYDTIAGGEFPELKEISRESSRAEIAGKIGGFIEWLGAERRERLRHAVSQLLKELEGVRDIHVDPRNFYAHAGMERNITAVKFRFTDEGVKVLIKYIDPEKAREIAYR